MWEEIKQLLGVPHNYHDNGTISMAKKIDSQAERKSAQKKSVATTKKARASVSKSAKKSTSPKKGMRNLVQAEGGYCFYVHEGPVVSNLAELLSVVEGIEDEQFFHHVNDERNDFALWIDAVLSDGVCARKLEKARTKDATVQVLRASLASYNV